MNRSYTAYVLLASILVIALAWTTFQVNPSASSLYWDYWEHAAAITEWKKNLWSPGNPHLATDEGSPRYMPFFFVLAVVAKVFNLDASVVLGMGAVLTSLIFVTGVFLFFRTYFRVDHAPIVGLIVLLFGWGHGYIWSSVYQLKSLIITLPYPSTFVFALTFVALWLATRVLRERAGAWIYVGLWLIAIVAFLSHPLSGAFAIGAVGLLALTEPAVALKRRIGTIVVVIAAALVAELWPYFSVWKIVLGLYEGAPPSMNFSSVGVHNTGRPGFYNPIAVVIALGPALLGGVVLLHLIRRRQELFIILGCFFVFLPYLLNLFLPIVMGHRFLIFVVFFLHLALTWALIRNPVESPAPIGLMRMLDRRRRVLIWFILPLLLVYQIGIAAFEIGGTHVSHGLHLQPRATSTDSIKDLMNRFASLVAAGDAVIMAPNDISWPMPTFVGKVVSLQKPNPMVSDRKTRVDDVTAFFAAATPAAQRNRILRRYGVTHVIYATDKTPAAISSYLDKIGRMLGSVDNYRVIKTNLH